MCGDRLKALSESDLSELYSRIISAGIATVQETPTPHLTVNPYKIRELDGSSYNPLNLLISGIKSALSFANQHQFNPPMEEKEFNADIRSTVSWALAKKLEERWKVSKSLEMPSEKQLDQIVKEFEVVVGLPADITGETTGGQTPPIDPDVLEQLIVGETPTSGSEETGGLVAWRDQFIGSLPLELKAFCQPLLEVSQVLVRNIFYVHLLTRSLALKHGLIQNNVPLSKFKPTGQFKIAIRHGMPAWTAAALIYDAVFKSNLTIGVVSGKIFAAQVSVPGSWAELNIEDEEEWQYFLRLWIDKVNISEGPASIKSGMTLEIKNTKEGKVKSLVSITKNFKSFAQEVKWLFRTAISSKMFDVQEKRLDFDNIEVVFRNGILRMNGGVFSIENNEKAWTLTPLFIRRDCPQGVNLVGKNLADIDWKAVCGRFQFMLNEVMPIGGRREDGEFDELADHNRDCIARLICACLFPQIEAKRFWYIYGAPNSGKSVVVRALHEIVGEQPFSIAVTTASLAGTFGAAGFDVARLATIQEPQTLLASEMQILTNHIKTLTGGDPVHINQKNVRARTAICKARFVIAANEQIPFQDESGGLASRLVPVFLKLAIRKPQEALRNETLRLELGGICAWALAMGMPKIRAALEAKECPLTPVIVDEQVARVHYSLNAELVGSTPPETWLCDKVFRATYRATGNEADRVNYSEIVQLMRAKIRQEQPSIDEEKLGKILSVRNTRDKGALISVMTRFCNDTKALKGCDETKVGGVKVRVHYLSGVELVDRLNDQRLVTKEY
jgi:hypothetical protein